MVVTEGNGKVVGDEVVVRDNAKGEPRFYVHFWPLEGARAHALEMDATTFAKLYETRKAAKDWATTDVQVKPGSVEANAAGAAPTDLALVDLKVIARIRCLAEGTVYAEKALEYIRAAEGDTLTLVQTAEALAEKLGAENGGSGAAAAG